MAPHLLLKYKIYTVNSLFSPPRRAYLFQAHLRGGGLNKDGGRI